MKILVFTNAVLPNFVLTNSVGAILLKLHWWLGQISQEAGLQIIYFEPTASISLNIFLDCNNSLFSEDVKMVYILVYCIVQKKHTYS